MTSKGLDPGDLVAKVRIDKEPRCMAMVEIRSILMLGKWNEIKWIDCISVECYVSLVAILAVALFVRGVNKKEEQRAEKRWNEKPWNIFLRVTTRRVRGWKQVSIAREGKHANTLRAQIRWQSSSKTPWDLPQQTWHPTSPSAHATLWLIGIFQIFVFAFHIIIWYRHYAGLSHQCKSIVVL